MNDFIKLHDHQRRLVEQVREMIGSDPSYLMSYETPKPTRNRKGRGLYRGIFDIETDGGMVYQAIRADPQSLPRGNSKASEPFKVAQPRNSEALAAILADPLHYTTNGSQ